MSRRATQRVGTRSARSVAIKWLERVEREGSREPVGHGGHRASKLMPYRAFLEAARVEKSDVTLQALCDRCQWRAESPQKWRRKIPQFGGRGSAVGLNGASIVGRPSATF